MKISALILTDQNNAIGKHASILQAPPAYLDYFEKVTQDYPVLMGRKSFESFGHALSSRRNVVITRSEKYHSAKARVFPSVKDALEAFKNEEKIFLIGGTKLFNAALPHIVEIYRTTIMAKFKSEDYYPEIDETNFELVSSECIKRDTENRFDYCVELWKRQK